MDKFTQDEVAALRVAIDAGRVEGGNGGEPFRYAGRPLRFGEQATLRSLADRLEEMLPVEPMPPFSIRVARALRKAGYTSVDELLDVGEWELLDNVKFFGIRALEQLRHYREHHARDQG